jgi:hypothetical protein
MGGRIVRGLHGLEAAGAEEEEKSEEYDAHDISFKVPAARDWEPMTGSKPTMPIKGGRDIANGLQMLTVWHREKPPEPCRPGVSRLG